MKKLLLALFVISGTVTTTAAEKIQNLVASGKPCLDKIITLSSSKRRLDTFFGNPKYKFRQIRQTLKQAQQKILLQRGFLNDYISAIIRNENTIAATSSTSTAQQLTRKNIRLMQKIEQIRIKIAQIQLNAQKKVLRIEQMSYLKIAGSVNRQRRRIQNSPASYWIWRRKHLLNGSELKNSLLDRMIRKYYR